MDSFCVHCDQRIDLGPGVRVGRRVACPACRAYLEVISVSPVELDWAYDEPYSNDQTMRIRSEQQTSLGDDTQASDGLTLTG